MTDTVMSTCPVCGRQFPAERIKGRYKIYDSEECRYTANNSARISESRELIDAKRHITELESQLRQEVMLRHQYMRMQEDLADRYRSLNDEVEAACADMRLMFDLGVLGVNRNSENHPLLAEHDGFLRLMERYQDNRDPKVKEEEKQYKEFRERQHEEIIRAQEAGASLDQQAVIHHRQLSEEMELRKHCQHYLAWCIIEDLKSQAREDQSIELDNNNPQLQRYFDIINDVIPGTIK